MPAPKPSPRLMLALVLLALAGVPAPAGLRALRCEIAIASSDPELRLSFARFDRMQSPSAARVCALFRNTIPDA